MPERLGCLSLIVALALLLSLRWVFAEVMEAPLLRLHLDPRTAILIVIGIFAGILINIPVKRLERDEVDPLDPLALFGLSGVWPLTSEHATPSRSSQDTFGPLVGADPLHLRGRADGRGHREHRRGRNVRWHPAVRHSGLYLS
jgi:hypothetical protein